MNRTVRFVPGRVNFVAAVRQLPVPGELANSSGGEYQGQCLVDSGFLEGRHKNAGALQTATETQVGGEHVC